MSESRVATSYCNECGMLSVQFGRCISCGWDGTLKVIDRRGSDDGKRQKAVTPPDFISEVKPTENPLEFVFVFPGNRVPEQKVRMTRTEIIGFKLATSRASGIGPRGKRAMDAAQRKVDFITRRARQIHEQSELLNAGVTNTVGPKETQ